MNLVEAQAQAWLHQTEPPKTIQQALSRLHETVNAALGAFEQDNLVQCQVLVENSLVQLLVAQKSLGLDPEQGLLRALERLKTQRQQTGLAQRAFRIHADRVELWDGAVYLAQWPLYTQEDYLQALQLARSLHCEVYHVEAEQLSLFAAANHPVLDAQPALAAESAS